MSIFCLVLFIVFFLFYCIHFNLCNTIVINYFCVSFHLLFLNLCVRHLFLCSIMTFYLIYMTHVFSEKQFFLLIWLLYRQNQNNYKYNTDLKTNTGTKYKLHVFS